MNWLVNKIVSKLLKDHIDELINPVTAEAKEVKRFRVETLENSLETLAEIRAEWKKLHTGYDKEATTLVTLLKTRLDTLELVLEKLNNNDMLSTYITQENRIRYLQQCLDMSESVISSNELNAYRKLKEQIRKNFNLTTPVVEPSSKQEESDG